jgi:hypothetical protein
VAEAALALCTDALKRVTRASRDLRRSENRFERTMVCFVITREWATSLAMLALRNCMNRASCWALVGDANRCAWLETTTKPWN